MWVQIVLFCVTCYTLYQLIKPRRPKNFPPGPPAYPIIGSAPDLIKLDPDIPVCLTKLGDVYGPISSIYLGKNAAVVVNGWDTVKEVLQRDEFSGRPPLFFANHPKLNVPLGLMFVTNNEFWRNQRRFSMRKLRDWGFGKKTLEGVMHEEVEECFLQIDKKLDASSERTITVHDAFGIPIINVLLAVLFGVRYSHEDKRLKDILQKIFESFRTQSHVNNLIQDYPVLQHVPFFAGAIKKFMRTKANTEKFIEEAIDDHLASRDPNSPRDFLDEYLNEMDSEKTKGVKDTSFYREQLVQLCLDVFNAGAESTSNSIAYALLYMVLNPEIQERVSAEITEVVGNDRLPSYEDKARLPYTEAVLSEVLRMANISPLTVPHYTMEDTKLKGYSIPKDTWVFASLISVHMETSTWGDPQNFRPERFLDADGKYVKPEQLIPFGIGKRLCMGEALARTNYFLFFASLVQRYRFEIPSGHSKPSERAVTGFTFAPSPFSAHLVRRNI